MKIVFSYNLQMSLLLHCLKLNFNFVIVRNSQRVSHTGRIRPKACGYGRPRIFDLR